MIIVLFKISLLMVGMKYDYIHLLKYGSHFENGVIAKRSTGKIFYFPPELDYGTHRNYGAKNLVGITFSG